MLVLATLSTLCAVLGSPETPADPSSAAVRRDSQLQDDSLETFLAHARRERDALHVRLRAAVQGLVERLAAKRRPGRLALTEMRDQLDALGPEAAPVLLPWIAPGAEPSQQTLFRTEEITAGLLRLRPAGVVDDLIRLASGDDEATRVNALRVLGVVPETERAGAFLSRIFTTSDGIIRLTSAESLASIGGTANTAVLEGALADEDTKIVRTVLGSLAAAKNAAAAPAVRKLTSLTSSAAPVTKELVAYWLAVPDLVDREILDMLVTLTLKTEVDALSRVAILDAIPKFSAARTREFRASLDPAAQSSNALVREAALACKALLGDRSARRSLLQNYNDDVKLASDWWKSFERRGNALLRIEEYAAAAKDLDEALDLLGQRARESQHDEVWINLARCYVFTRKLNRAAATLKERGLTHSMKVTIRSDPDFAELVEHARYGAVLR